MEKGVDRKLVIMEKKTNNIQCQRPETVPVALEDTGRMKTPCFDGSILLSVFKLQFDTVASRSGWDDEEAFGTYLGLKGPVVEIPETMPASCRNNYNCIMVALQRRFGDERKITIPDGDKVPSARGGRWISAAHIPKSKPPTGKQF